MLGKLIKYEFKALYKKILLCVLGGMLISLLTLLLFQLAVTSGGNNIMLQLFWSSGMIFTVLALAAVGILTLVFIIQRFYTNLYKDEGYLSFSLPVTPSQQLWAKLISGAFWTVISGAGVIVSFGLLFGGIIQAAGNYTGENIFAYITTSIEYILSVTGIQPGLFVAELLVSLLISVFSNMMIIYLCITLGSAVAAKHKVLIAILLYFAITMGLSWVTGLVNIIVAGISFNGMPALEAGGAYHIVTAVNSALYICIFGAAFGICKSIMTKRLNLE